MNKRATLTTLLTAAALLVVLAFAIGACGSGGETTTTAAPATTAAAPTTTASAPGTETTAAGTQTTAGGTGTTLGSVTVPSIQMTQEVMAYLGQMQTVFGSLESSPENADPFSITDVSKVTDAQIQAAEAELAQVKTALDGLKALTPPAELAAFQQALVGAVQSALDIAQKGVDALKNKDQAALDATKAEADKLEEQMNGLLDSLLPLLMGGTATT